MAFTLADADTVIAELHTLAARLHDRTEQLGLMVSDLTNDLNIQRTTVVSNPVFTDAEQGFRVLAALNDTHKDIANFRAELQKDQQTLIKAMPWPRKT